MDISKVASVSEVLSAEIKKVDKKDSKKSTSSQSVDMSKKEILATLRNALGQHSPVKTSPLSEIKKQYNNKTYSVNCQKISEKIVALEELWF